MADAERNDVAAKEHKNGNKISEPSEADPCIEEKHHKNKFLDNVENSLRQKTGLSATGVRYGIAIVLLTILLFVVVIALAIAWPSIPHHQQFPVCESPACLRASAQIQDSLNASARPCENIWGWACGNWLARNSLPVDKGVWNQKEQLAKQEAVLVRDLITTLPLPLRTGTLECKLMYFYESCMDIDAIEIDRERGLTDIIDELGGWKVLRNWNKDDYNAADLLENLHVQHGVSPYFKISVVPHHNSPGSSIIRISPSGLGLPDRNYYFNRENDDAIEKAYIHFISDVVINLSTTKEEADRFGRDLYYYEKRIAEITPESGEFQDPIKTYDIRTIQELRRTVPQLRIHEILPRMYPEANINELTEVVLTSAQYLEEVATISSTTDKIASNSYFIWTLVREYLPYLNAKFAASWNSFNHAILGIQKPPERWEFCVNLAQRFMGLVVEAFLERKKPITNSTRSVVNEVYESIRQTVSKRLDTFQSMPNLHSHLTNKLKTLELEIGLPQNISTEEYLKFFYKKMNVVRKSFFNNYKKGVTFLKKVEERRLISSHTQDYTLSYIYSKPSFVQYSPSVNKIVVPSILLSNFYFEDKYPWSVIYGRVGVEIAQAVVSSVLPYDNVWTTDMKLLTQFHVTVNESMNVVQHSKNCILDFVIKGRYASEIVANLTVLDVVKTISAVQIAEEALNSITATKEHVHQPSFETMEDFQLFYLTYSQSLCSVTTEDYKLYNSLQNYRFPQKELLDVLWHQIPGFKQAFSCSTGSSKRCSDTF